MKGERIKYPTVEQLPKDAVKIRTFAESRGFTVSYVYKMYKGGKVKIVEFEGINFVIS